MGVEIYRLDRETRRTLRIVDTRHEVGLVRRLWKATATDLGSRRGETLEALADEQATRAVETPRAVIVDAPTDFELDGRFVLGRRVLGWHAGRLVTQDLDWDHQRSFGWAVDEPDGEATLQEERDGHLVAVDVARGHELGILEPNTNGLAEHHPSTIAECRFVRRLSTSHYEAGCRLADDREVVVLGESESGELPDASWFRGLTTAKAARFKLVWAGDSTA